MTCFIAGKSIALAAECEHVSRQEREVQKFQAANLRQLLTLGYFVCEALAAALLL
jgi:hypothetical protein